jgi:DDE family transposase
MIDEAAIRQRFEAMRGQLDERGLRLLAAAEARTAGYGGVAAVARATGLARSTIGRGLKDLEQPAQAPGQVRRAGSGRRPVQAQDPTLLADLRALVEPATRGDPMRPLLWVSKSHAKLAAALGALGHRVSPNTVGRLLRKELGFSRQANRKTLEGASHPDRDAQFGHINARAHAFQASGDPVISVDTKKKELIGPFKNGGSDYRPKGCPDAVNVHDFADKMLGKVAPYGIYDPVDNRGWVSLGIDHDTAEFAVNAIRTWHERVGRGRYPLSRRLLITADCGGSNGARVRLWKRELQRLADATGLTLAVSHYPPGTSKWNQIEHRLFCHISQSWRGKPLLSHLAVVELIAATTTITGLTVGCVLDPRRYATGIKVSDAEMQNLNIQGDAFHPEWNYTISPRHQT